MNQLIEMMRHKPPMRVYLMAGADVGTGESVASQIRELGHDVIVCAGINTYDIANPARTIPAMMGGDLVILTDPSRELADAQDAIVAILEVARSRHKGLEAINAVFDDVPPYTPDELSESGKRWRERFRLKAKEWVREIEAVKADESGPPKSKVPFYVRCDKRNRSKHWLK